MIRNGHDIEKLASSLCSSDPLIVLRAESPQVTTIVSRMKTRFILINTSHAGNVGAAARAMKVMGFDDLVLVAPRWPDVLQHEEARAMASGATDVLERARVVPALAEALDGVTCACATA